MMNEFKKLNMIQPPFLREGDTVAIVCTARKLSVQETLPAVELLESWGLKVLYGSTIGQDNYQLGGSDELRASDFNAMLANDQVKAIWCARGGYGTVRIIDDIDFGLLKTNPKWIIGFSDATVLHSELHVQGVQSIHGIMAFSVPRSDTISMESLRRMIFGHEIQYDVAAEPLNIPGTATGVLVGGNLSILYSLLGSKSAISTDHKILFIEDLDEYLYHLDRMMYNLKRNGYFTNLRGMIVGGMTDMHDNNIPFGQNALEIIRSMSEAYGFPLAFNFPSGHGSQNLSLRLGAFIELDVSDQGTTVRWV